ncbi:hypothetical protein PG990_001423 [Apiospora arundinis]
MADIESQGQGAGKVSRNTAPPSYTRLCTYKILPICLAICVISVFSAAIVCTSLNKPVPSSVVIVFSILAGCLLLLMFFGYLKIYHDRSGMSEVHPRAEQALKVFRDRLVKLFCCIEMDSYATPNDTKTDHEEALKTAPKEDVGGHTVQPRATLAGRHSERGKPLQRYRRTIHGPRPQPKTPGQDSSHPPNPYHVQSDQRSQMQAHPESLRPAGNRRPLESSPRFHQAASTDDLGIPQGMGGFRLGSETADIDIGYMSAPHGNDTPSGLSSQQERHSASAMVPPLNTSRPKRGPNNMVPSHLVRVPDIEFRLRAILGDNETTTPSRGSAKPGGESLHNEEDVEYYHKLFASPHTSTVSLTTPDASTTTANSLNSSSISSLTTPTEKEGKGSLSRFPAQCRAEQRILLKTQDIMAKHRANYHIEYPAGLEYCRFIQSERQTASGSTSQSGDHKGEGGHI